MNQMTEVTSEFRMELSGAFYNAMRNTGLDVTDSRGTAVAESQADGVIATGEQVGKMIRVWAVRYLGSTENITAIEDEAGVEYLTADKVRGAVQTSGGVFGLVRVTAAGGPPVHHAPEPFRGCPAGHLRPTNVPRFPSPGSEAHLFTGGHRTVMGAFAATCARRAAPWRPATPPNCGCHAHPVPRRLSPRTTSRCRVCCHRVGSSRLRCGGPCTSSAGHPGPPQR